MLNSRTEIIGHSKLKLMSNYYTDFAAYSRMKGDAEGGGGCPRTKEKQFSKK